MATGIELMLTAICINATCMPSENFENVLVNRSQLFNNELIDKKYLIDPDKPFNKSIEEKHENLMKLRNWLNGRHIRVATIEDYPLSYTKYENGTTNGYGAAFTLINFLSKKFNFTYEVIVPHKNIIGAANDMQGSLLHLMNTSEADLAAAFIPLLGNTRDFWFYSTTTLDEGEWIMLMVRPSESATGSGLLAPFDVNVWILIMVSLFLIGPMIYCLIILRNKLTGDDTQTIYSLGHCAWFVYGALMKQGSTLAPLADSTRIIFATWWIFITILTSFYTANLTAFLTLSKFTLPFNTVKDIMHYEKHFVAIRGGAIEYAIKNPQETLSDLSKMVYKKRAVFTQNLNDTDTLMDYVEKRKYVFIRDRPAVDHLVYKDYRYRKTLSYANERIHCPFATSTIPFLKKKRAFAYPNGSNLSTLFDPELLNLVEAGILKYLTHEKLPLTEICPQNLGGTERQLRVGDLAMTYYIVMSGFGTGVVIFFTEILFKYINNRLDHKKQEVGHTLQGNIKNVQFPFGSNTTPPPPYASIFNNSRKLKTSFNEIILPPHLEGRKGVKKFINGRDYIVYTGSDGANTLVPLRAPSAALFQYSYAK